MTKLVYYIFYTLSLLPFRVLYALSDLEFLIVYRLIGYRRKIVRSNLTSSFPEKNEAEIKEIERGFYHWFCDYFFETIKLLSLSDKELKKRLIITNSAEHEQWFKQGRNTAAILGHYCNWEWLSRVGYKMEQNRRVGLIYGPLHSKAFDYLFFQIRTYPPTGVPVPKKQILRQLLSWKREGRMSLCGYIADQAPKWENIHCWLPFLNHNTPVFTGAERIMRKMNNVVYYVDMTRPKRGYYQMTYRLITDDPNSLPEFEITRRFFQMLETSIRNNPVSYLWTHNRWKRTYEEFNRRFMTVNGKIIPRTKE
ncbi:lipid A biosynthesis (KDO)2-(lauroyl)-lipid IVA acyltransferase [Bacteroidales bacterium KA00344]|nr:lipid A biosynthesis (KDO)2-(lauroyl)-lipid IVA acyltransferase [Bacteroidales bacterium KA00344]